MGQLVQVNLKINIPRIKISCLFLTYNFLKRKYLTYIASVFLASVL